MRKESHQMKTLEQYRAEIDALDDEIIALLGKRFEIVKNVGHLKTAQNLEIIQHKRVREVLDRARELGVKNDLDPDFMSALYTLMIDHAHDLESGIKNGNKQTRK
jgi:monofunctional chorismate mutase